MAASLYMVSCEDEMSLHVSIVGQDSSENVGVARNIIDDDSDDELVKVDDLCSGLKCNPGERCVINENEAACECIEVCDTPSDERQKVCSSSNVTFESDCHFLREKCWCKSNDLKCTDASVLNDKLDYYGACRMIDTCGEEQKKVFPIRMKVWLDKVLHILNERKDLDPKYNNLVKMADEMKANNVEKYWTAGVAFEFCQLDKSKDHAIQKEELRFLISSIKSLENCIQPFLDECDKDNNDLITDKEWGTCLDLSDDDLELLRKYC